MEIDYGIFVMPLPYSDGDERNHADDGNGDDEVRAEPIVALAFIEDDLHGAEAECEQAEADVIHAEAGAFLLLHVGRIADEHVGEQQRNDAYGDVDEENPAPVEIVGDPSAQGGADGRSEHHRHAVNGEGHAAFSRFESVGENCLLAGLQAAAADALQHAKNNQHAEVGREAAEKRADGEERDAGHVKTFAAYELGKPAAHRENDGVGNQVGSEHPGAFVLAGGKAAGDVRQGDVGDAGVEDFHERRQSYGERDDPRINDRARAPGGIHRDRGGAQIISL